MDGDDRELFERSLRHAAQTCSGAELDRALIELGWIEALEFDERLAVSAWFETQGASATSSGALELVLMHALGLHDIGSDTALVLPQLGSTSVPGQVVEGRLNVHGLVLGSPGADGHDRHSSYVVVWNTGSTTVAHLATSAAVTLRPISGIDPALGLLRVRGESMTPDDAPRLDTDPLEWGRAVAAAQVALGYELVGASRTMLAQAVEHALGRIQFGRPISQFQAVRHRLAEVLIAIETADAMLDAAWQDRTATSAAMAKSLSGRAARLAARNCQQVLAGVGFTTEHPLHLTIRRVLVLDELLGSARRLTRELGDSLIESRALPPLPLL
ncbi:MAG: acyl-CoA dehydrogenase family protein [Microthrixaceae bacterium]